jgi:hypothetical protein
MSSPMRQSLDFERMITEGAELWRDVNKGLDSVEGLVASAADDPAQLVSATVTTFAYVRAQQEKLRRYLRERCGVEVDDTPDRGPRIRVVDKELARVKTSDEALYRYYVVARTATATARAGRPHCWDHRYSASLAESSTASTMIMRSTRRCSRSSAPAS